MNKVTILSEEDKKRTEQATMQAISGMGIQNDIPEIDESDLMDLIKQTNMQHNAVVQNAEPSTAEPETKTPETIEPEDNYEDDYEADLKRAEEEQKQQESTTVESETEVEEDDYEPEEEYQEDPIPQSLKKSPKPKRGKVVEEKNYEEKMTLKKEKVGFQLNFETIKTIILVFVLYNVASLGLACILMGVMK